ncbi:MAG: OmpA family protein [Gammaproteobacteria bacterium]|nr:OmpA family protein [Gammaproteobacteria bacterium]
MGQRLQWILFAVLLGASFGAQSAEPASAEGAATGIPAFPASFECSAGSDDCPSVLKEPQSMVFVTRIPFQTGSALLTEQAKNELLRFLVELESFSIVQGFSIVGHSDPSGPEDFNRWLSEKRAAQVSWHFRQSGVDPRTIDISGAGSLQPYVGAIDPAEHRRVEVRVTVRPFL